LLYSNEPIAGMVVCVSPQFVGVRPRPPGPTCGFWPLRAKVSTLWSMY